MIKAIILDIDGVIVGEKVGFNSPEPHPDVINALLRVRLMNIPIILCTAKPHYAIINIIRSAKLNNPHITDAGAVIIDPINNIISKMHVIEKSLVYEVIGALLEEDVYTEFYTTEDYFISKNQKGEITKKHQHILQKPPKTLSNFLLESSNHEITKIMPIALNEEDKQSVNEILKHFAKRLFISWGVHPIALPLQFGIITALGSSKKRGVQDVLKNLEIKFSDTLGIGDSTSDWSFMQNCRYVATVENGSKEIKSLIKQKAEGNYFIGKSVDENGALSILKFFSLI